MNTLWLRWILTFVLLLASGLTEAAQLSTLYSAAVPVQTQSSKEQKQALKKAFESVLIKVSGFADIIQRSDMVQAINHPKDYVQTFHYSPVLDNNQPVAKTFLLQASFDEEAVNQLLNNADIIIWGKERPLVLTWLVVDNATGRTLVNPDDQCELADVAKRSLHKAISRGIPMIWPLLDITDRQQITVDAVMNFKTDSIRQASIRYNPDAILIGYIRTGDNSNGHSDWMLLQPKTTATWATKGSSIVEQMDGVIDHFTEVFSKQFVQPTAADIQSGVELHVSDLRQVSDYAAVVNYLHTLTGIKEVEVLRITKNSADFRLTLISSLSTLIQTMQMNPSLMLIEDDDANKIADEMNETSILNYRFIPT